MRNQPSEDFSTRQDSINIVRSGVERSDEVLRLLREAAGWMESQGIMQWTPGQFLEEDIIGYFKDREVYVALDNGTVAGMFTLQFSDPQYWGDRNDESYAYLHRLAVAKTHRGVGLGQQLLSFAVQKAAELGCKALRLDTVAHNVKLNRYYQSTGFRFKGFNDIGNGRLVSLYEHAADNEDEKSILLRYVEESDFSSLKQWSVSPEFLKQWAGPSLNYPLEDGQLREYLNGANHPALSDKLIYSAVQGKSRRPVGHISLSAIDRENGSARISRVIVDPAEQGQGIGLRMVREVMRIGFEGLGLHRLSLGVFAFNARALKCYEAAGFIHEGIVREAALFADGYADCVEMGILDREWKVLRSL